MIREALLFLASSWTPKWKLLPKYYFSNRYFCFIPFEYCCCSHVIMWARLNIAESSVWWKALNIYTTSQIRQLFSDPSISKGNGSPAFHSFLHSAPLSCDCNVRGTLLGTRRQRRHSPALRGLTVQSRRWHAYRVRYYKTTWSQVIRVMEPKCDGCSEMEEITMP